MNPPAILVIERSPINGALLRALLTRAGYQVALRTDAAGIEAYLMAFRPDLVELSLWLAQPQDGLALIAVLAANPITRTIPLLICSGDLFLLQTHADDWRARGYGVLGKPFTEDELLTLVHALLAAGPLEPIVI